MKKAICLFLICLLLFSTHFFTAFSSFDENGYIVRFPGLPKISLDGKYEYDLDEKTKEASFVKSFETDITVLEIPKEIDGYVITNLSSSVCRSVSLVRVKYPETVRHICMWGAIVSDRKVPLCMIDINEGLKSIAYNGFGSNGSYPFSCKLLIFPSSLEYIGEQGVRRGFCENLVFQSNPVTNMNSVTVDDGEYAYFPDGYYQMDINYYFTGDATNLSEFTFNYKPYNWEHDLASPETFPTRGVTIYKKPGAQGFEKFLDSSHEEYITDYSISWKIPEYTVKEYTEEWWHDLAEIETVTMTAEGMSKITKNKGKGLSDAAKKYLSHEYEKSVKSGEAFTVSSAFAPADAYDNRTFFVSMNEDVATVDIETGEVKALKKGTARIRCVAASGVFADCVLSVDGGDGTNGVKPTEAEVEANSTTSAASSTETQATETQRTETQTTETQRAETQTTELQTTKTTATASQTQPNKALSFLADKKFYIIPAAVVLTAAVAAVCIVRKKKR